MIEKNSIKLPLDGVLRLQKTLLMVTLELGGIKINAACPGGSQETLIPQSEHGEEKNNGAITIVIFILKTEN